MGESWADSVARIDANQVRRTVDVLGHVHAEPPTGPTRVALLDAFHDFRRE